jgi:hypothetical protein
MDDVAMRSIRESTYPGRAPGQNFDKEAAMVLDDALDSSVDDAFLRTEARWLERIPPELEWDESEIALLVQQVVGGSPLQAFNPTS